MKIWRHQETDAFLRQNNMGDLDAGILKHSFIKSVFL